MNAQGDPPAADMPLGAGRPIVPHVDRALRLALGDALAVTAVSGGRGIVAALLGRGIGASRTPGMHEAEGARLELSYAYRLVDFDRLGLADSDLEATIVAAQALGLRGLNVTHPFKETVVRYLDDLSPNAAAIGAVNTVVLSVEEAIGHNTDSFGFSESFSRELPGARLDQVVLIGAGGGGMAVAHALLTLGTTTLRIFDQHPHKAEMLAGKLAREFPEQRVLAINDLSSWVKAASGIVNATPSGMTKYPGSPLDEALLRPELWVADIIYFPAETALISAAKATGCRTLGGAGMAIFQAVRAFELISGEPADPERNDSPFCRGALSRSRNLVGRPPCSRGELALT